MLEFYWIAPDSFYENSIHLFCIICWFSIVFQGDMRAQASIINEMQNEGEALK